MSEIVQIEPCKKCGLVKAMSKTNNHICEDCEKAENNRISYFRQHNFNWIDVAKEAEIELWERQPAETDLEWSVWLAYRDSYPSVKPSYKRVAEQLCTTINVVKKVGQRWSFATRMQAWAKYVDELTLAERKKEIVDMNKRHISMADKINQKLEHAIDSIDPFSLKPAELQGLLKLSTELERKARLDGTELHKAQATTDDNPALKKATTKTDDLSEVIGILGKAGILGNFGIKQTTTTEVVVKEGDE